VIAPPSALLLLAVGCLLLAGLGLSGVFLLRGIEQRRRVESRIERVLRPLARTQPLRPAAISRPAAHEERGLLGWAGWAFGFDPGRIDRYPAPWWAVLAGACAVGWVGGEIASNLFGKAGLVAWPLLWLIVARAWFGRMDWRRRQQLFVQMPDALSMIVRAVRVGIPIPEAIRAIAQEADAPTAVEFAALNSELVIGVPLEEGLRAMARRTGLGEYRFFATAVSVQSQTGGGLTEVMENLADVIRRRVALQSRGHALSAEARTSAIVLAIMPVVTGVMLWFINPSYIGSLFDRPIGHTLLGVSASLLAIGTFVMRTIIRRTLA
jgi:tight adherence protein B